MLGLKLTELVAWYAATVSTIVLLWDVYKWWRTGAQLRVLTQPNMIEVGAGTPWAPPGNGATRPKHISVEIANVGGRKTTVTHIGLRHYSSMWSRIRRKTVWQAVVPDPRPGKIPFEIDVGGRWIGLIEQDEKIERDARTGRLYVVVGHATSKRLSLTRVDLK